MVALNRVMLGCPVRCDGWTCVDLHPQDSEVVNSDVYSYLLEALKLGLKADEIRSDNLIEHLPDVGRFFLMCGNVLRSGGRLVVKTDNASWMPFYVPFALRGTGLGAHSCNSYVDGQKWERHLSVFTATHLRNLFEYARFSGVSVRHDWSTFGARLIAEGVR